MLITFDIVRVIRACVRTARTLNNVSGFDSCLPSRKVREKNFLFLAVFASETEIPLAGDKGAHSFDPRFLLQTTGERNGASDVPALIRRDVSLGQEKYGPIKLRTYFRLPPTDTIFWISFGSSGSSPDFGSLGVKVIQFRSIANTRRNSGSDSSTRPMLTRATACQ